MTIHDEAADAMERWKSNTWTIHTDWGREMKDSGDDLARLLRAALADVARVTEQRDMMDQAHEIEMQTHLSTLARAAAAEKMLRFAAGRISTEPEWASKHPEEVLAWIREECERDSARAAKDEE